MSVSLSMPPQSSRTRTGVSIRARAVACGGGVWRLGGIPADMDTEPEVIALVRTAADRLVFALVLQLTEVG